MAGGSLSSLAATCSSPPLTATPISASLKPSVEIETIDAAQAATTPVLSQVPQGMTDAAPTVNAVLANTAPTINAVPADAASTMNAVLPTTPVLSQVPQGMTDAAPMANAVLANTVPAINAVPADAAPTMNAAVADTAPAVTTAPVDTTPADVALGVLVGPTKSSDSSSQPQVELVNQRLPRRRGKDVTGIAAEPAKNDGSAAAAGNASGNVASTSTSASAGFKKLTQSNAPKNLYYQEYLKEHPAITPAAFKMHWKGLPKDTQKHWAEVSRSKKAALASVGNGEEVINN
ncbi:hypothetical protein BDZ97DRAFT_1918198 [Flammula alnicola]|nr:hypothetical protein BDZ97DRAFT_1918198 [Flammula alnicola]